MGANNLIEPIDARPVFTAFSATLPPTFFFFLSAPIEFVFIPGFFLHSCLHYCNANVANEREKMLLLFARGRKEKGRVFVCGDNEEDI